MIAGVGTDITHIERIRKLRPAALDRVFTPKEQRYCRRYADPFPHYAGRFAAKEAILKALGTGLAEEITWKQMEILPNALGAPQVALSGAAKRRMRKIGATHCHLSISHQVEYAIAFAVLENTAISPP